MTSRPSNRSRPKDLIVPSIKEHKQSFILLHRKGDVANAFGPGLLWADAKGFGTFPEIFPHAKFIFPQAPKRESARAKGWKLFQWFDNWGYDEDAEDKEDLKVEGLQETTAMVHDLLKQEIELVGAENVVLGGLSQGCAASHVAILTWQGEPLAGCFQMCGHLPFRAQIEAAELDKSAGETSTSGLRAHSWIREKLDLPNSETASRAPPFMQTPIFIGHGDEDEVVPTRLGREAGKCFEQLGAQSEYHEYKGLAHWYNHDMLHDYCMMRQLSRVR
jgi:predicted esterase